MLSSPRTPRSRPLSSFFVTANRKSTDSWNSSNQDELDYDWKPDQTLLLSRTLDALPAHLLTPFNGPIPPSNLLDKIARGVANAKGPGDWPHSIRATRVKLMELARIRAKESARDENCRMFILEEDEISQYSGGSGEVFQQSTNTVSRRPPYRQSSMDFMNTAKTELNDNDNIARLSTRLQRTDRLIPNPSYHPYSRPSLHHQPCSTPRPRSPQSSNPLKACSTAINTSLPSGPSSSSRPRPLSRSSSTLSNTSDPHLRRLPEMVEDPRVQRIRRSDSLCAPPSNRKPKPLALKRAPSFAAARDNGSSSPSPSSDEEEKIRSKHAKKLRTKTVAPSSTTSPPPPPSKSRNTRSNDGVEPRSKTRSKSSGSTSSSSKSSSTTAKSSSSSATTVTSTYSSHAAPTQGHKAKNIRCDPIMFGPALQNPPSLSTPPRTSHTTTTTTTTTTTIHRGSPSAPNTASFPKTLRRVRATSFARAPARRISFGSLVAPAEEAEIDADAEGEGLGSAFQLR